jgi:hypothetical protein
MAVPAPGGAPEPGTAEPGRLSDTERFVALGGGLVLFLVALWLLAFPPDHDEVLPDCTPSAGLDCVASVSDVPETVTSVVVGAAAALILVAVLGIRFRTVKIPGGIELSVDPVDKSEADAAKENGEVEEAVPTPTAHVELEALESNSSTLWASLPPVIQRRVAEAWKLAGNPGSPAASINQVYRPRRGHDLWYVEFLDGTTWRVREAEAAGGAARRSWWS